MAMHTPREAWRGDVKALHRLVRFEGNISRRMLLLARALVGRPYLCDPLGGGAAFAEKLSINLLGFDCVTFVETLLALARSRSTQEFLEELVAMRYRDGKISWQQRLHFFTDWLTCNQRRGIVVQRTKGAGARSLLVELSVLPELPARQVRLQIVPKKWLHKAKPRIEDGAIVAFGSLRRGLDFFHTGVLFWQEADKPRGADELVLIHAAKSTGQVTMEPLPDFLRRNRMRGMAFAIPRDKGET